MLSLVRGFHDRAVLDQDAVRLLTCVPDDVDHAVDPADFDRLTVVDGCGRSGGRAQVPRLESDLFAAGHRDLPAPPSLRIGNKRSACKLSGQALSRMTVEHPDQPLAVA